MKYEYYVIDTQKALPLLSIKMLTDYYFKEETLEDGTQVHGVLTFNGELSNKCLEISGVIRKENDDDAQEIRDKADT